MSFRKYYYAKLVFYPRKEFSEPMKLNNIYYFVRLMKMFILIFIQIEQISIWSYHAKRGRGSGNFLHKRPVVWNWKKRCALKGNVSILGWEAKLVWEAKLKDKSKLVNTRSFHALRKTPEMAWIGNQSPSCETTWKGGWMVADYGQAVLNQRVAKEMKTLVAVRSDGILCSAYNNPQDGIQTLV